KSLSHETPLRVRGRRRRHERRYRRCEPARWRGRAGCGHAGVRRTAARRAAAAVTLERLWAGWRSEYIEGVTTDDGEEGCVFCRILASDAPDAETYVVWRNEGVAALLNAYPYTSGHLLVLPVRHVSELEDLDGEEAAALWTAVTQA